MPYLAAPAEKTEAWRRKLQPTNDRLRVGIVWAGNPGHTNDRNRSCTLDHFASLAGIAGVAFYSLQKEAANPQCGWPENALAPLFDPCPDIQDFSDAAALIRNLDLVISVDTSIAHLAGALAKPVWTLLPLACDWRWLIQRTDSPWYPTMRLFRQRRPGAWTEVFEEVAEALRVERERASKCSA